MSYQDFLNNFITKHFTADPLLKSPLADIPVNGSSDKQHGAEDLSPMEKSTQGLYDETPIQNETDLKIKSTKHKLRSPKPAQRLKLTMPDPFHPSNQIWTPETETATSAQSPKIYSEWIRVPWPPPPEHLACLSLRERIKFSKVRRRIRNLRDPFRETRYDRIFRFLYKNPEYKEHPLYCTDRRLRENYGFDSPRCSKTGDEHEGLSADNDHARALMLECEHQEQLYRYRIRYQERVYSPPVSPTTTSPSPGDWRPMTPYLAPIDRSAGDSHTGLLRGIPEIRIKAESQGSSCSPEGTRAGKPEKSLKRKVEEMEEMEDNVANDTRITKRFRIGKRRVKSL